MKNMKYIKNKGIYKFIKLFCLLLLIIFLNGCFMPSFTHSKGTVLVQVNQENVQSPNEIMPERFIIVSFWEYPMVNNSRGKVVVSEVLLTGKQQIEVNFPHKGYWVVWTPALGTQHLAPEPGIMVFHENYSPRWSLGGTDSRLRVCCEKPEKQHNFQFIFDDSDENMLLKRIDEPSVRIFFEEFLAEKEHLIKKVEKCRGITNEEENMVIEKLRQIEKILNM